MIDLVSVTLIDSTLLPRRIWQVAIVIVLLLGVLRFLFLKNPNTQPALQLSQPIEPETDQFNTNQNDSSPEEEEKQDDKNP